MEELSGRFLFLRILHIIFYIFRMLFIFTFFIFYFYVKIRIVAIVLEI